MTENVKPKLAFTAKNEKYVPKTYAMTGRELPEKYWTKVYEVVAEEIDEEMIKQKYDQVWLINGNRVVMKGESERARTQAMRLATEVNGTAYRNGKEMCLVTVMVKEGVKIGEIRKVWSSYKLWVEKTRFYWVDKVLTGGVLYVL